MENKSQKQNCFSYVYSAKEQAELKKIREKYTPPTEKEDKMERLRRLDQRVTQKAQIVSLIFGIVGALVLGFGMSLAMSDLGEMLGAYRNWAMLFGIIIGMLGGLLACLAYPMYHFVTKRERKRIAPEIIRLTDELMK